jgi:ABC-type dipeptide/oligopeptide/nickel transport system permease component
LRLGWYILRRLLMLVPQLLAISFVTFLLIRLLPGNPAYRLLGPLATDSAVAELSHKMGLDRSLLVQYRLYLERVSHGDLGTSWYTSRPVADDLLQRFPATLELISLALVMALLFGIGAGLLTATKPRGVADHVARIYGLMAGAFPDFWIGLVLIFIFYYKLRLFPAPLGRLDISVDPPASITGLYTVDSLLTLNWEAFRSSISHLALPVFALAFGVAAPIMKMTRTTMMTVLESNFIRHARACGVSPPIVARYALRNTLAPVITIIAVLYGYLLGGAVLIENIFAWNGIGQYAVQAVVNSDYSALQGFVLVAAVFTLVVYLIVDLLYIMIDPRISL